MSEYFIGMSGEFELSKGSRNIKREKERMEDNLRVKVMEDTYVY